VIADVTDPDAIQTILAHLKQRAQFSKPVSV
jgi:hypothetical protein